MTIGASRARHNRIPNTKWLKVNYYSPLDGMLVNHSQQELTWSTDYPPPLMRITRNIEESEISSISGRFACIENGTKGIISFCNICRKFNTNKGESRYHYLECIIAPPSSSAVTTSPVAAYKITRSAF